MPTQASFPGRGLFSGVERVRYPNGVNVFDWFKDGDDEGGGNACKRCRVY